ncbi:glycoside hydrolase family 9 protein [Sorangium sp. So ce513]|uniref:glycoside hydrolase family 9 protein n=1 Tax=Sorangium sp. So ce513 TaxID=3133315 RepID=UPI003F6422D6
MQSTLHRFVAPTLLSCAVVVACSGGDDSVAGSGGSGAAAGSGGPATTGSGASGPATTGSGGSGGSSVEPSAPMSEFIVVDQFGYLPDAEKIAVLRDPEIGFDADASFTPGATIALVSSATGEHVLTAAPAPWRDGATDASSGDKAWWFDFSSVTAPGRYYVLDVENSVRSAEFEIGDAVYREVLKQAVRTFFYQRAGQKKDAAFAGEAWADEASHVGPLQDRNARLYSAPDDASTERDVSGGWYDAGDYNKYTAWTANYVVTLLRAYAETPSVWTDDYDIPESGNGVPDLLDEVKWGMDWLVRMQNADGSVLSIVGLSDASPPSAAKGPSRYGSASTTATLATAAAFAYGAKVLKNAAGGALASYADSLLPRAESAWAWADANPAVIFRNNDADAGTSGLGAGQQETDDYGRLSLKVEAASYLFDATGKAVYRDVVDANYEKIHLMEWSFAYPFEVQQQAALLHYSSVAGATPAVAQAIRSTYRAAMDGDDNLAAFRAGVDPYLAHLKDYTWGSNAIKAHQGNMFYDLVTHALDASVNEDAVRAAARYVHYIHGVNPLGLVYLSNMGAYGAERSVNEFYHTWFQDGSERWDRVGVSTYGPAPGFLTGGPNPSYEKDGCCPDSCGSPENNARCDAESVSPPTSQPAQKSYKDFNTNWPLNSWAVTENSNGYQVSYIRLLSKLVR